MVFIDKNSQIQYSDQPIKAWGIPKIKIQLENIFFAAILAKEGV